MPLNYQVFSLPSFLPARKTGLAPDFLSPMIERFKREHSLVVQALEERNAVRTKGGDQRP
jgi:hypothetical protein